MHPVLTLNFVTPARTNLGEENKIIATKMEKKEFDIYGWKQNKASQ